MTTPTVELSASSVGACSRGARKQKKDRMMGKKITAHDISNLFRNPSCSSLRTQLMAGTLSGCSIITGVWGIHVILISEAALMKVRSLPHAGNICL